MLLKILSSVFVVVGGGVLFLFFYFYLKNYIYLLGGTVCHDVCVEVKGYLLRVIFFLELCAF